MRLRIWHVAILLCVALNILSGQTTPEADTPVENASTTETPVEAATTETPVETTTTDALAPESSATEVETVAPVPFEWKEFGVGVGKTVLAMIVLVLLFRVMNWLFPRLYARIESWRDTRIPSFRIQSLELLSSTRITDILIGGARILRVAVAIGLLYLYLPLLFSFFPQTHGWAQVLFGYVSRPAFGFLMSLVAYLPNVFQIAVVVFLTYYAMKFTKYLFQQVDAGVVTFSGFYHDWAMPTYQIVRILIVVFAAMLVFPLLPGYNSEGFKQLSVFFGILFSLGSTAVIANIVAGTVMVYMRAFKVGDRVQIADTTGDVIEKGLLVTRIRTIKHVDVTIPNALVLGSHIINYSSSSADEEGLVLHTTITIGYDVPWRQVHELLIEAALRTEFIEADPAPYVFQTSLDDFYVSYELNAYTHEPRLQSRMYSLMHQHIQDLFGAAGVEIMSPHYGAMRDGNMSTIPAEHLPPNYEPPFFRLLTGQAQTVQRAPSPDADGGGKVGG